MEFFRRAVLLSAAVLLGVACSKSEEEPYIEKETRSFEAWMSKYINTDPDNPVAAKLTYGGYIQWLSSNDTIPEERPGWGDYVEINYRGMLLSDWDHTLEKGSMFVTRYREDAERMGTYTYYTHYAPQLVVNSRTNYLMGGMQDALQLMKVGDVVRLYLPYLQSETSSTILTMTSGSGYDGETSNPSLQPVIVEMELVSVIDNPQTLEENYVIEYADTAWGKTLADTVRQYVFINVDESTKTEYVATADSTVNLYYVARLAYDNFLIETNIDSVALDSHRTAASTISFKASTSSDSDSGSSVTAMTVQALKEIFNTEEITYGCTFDMITTSLFGFGSTGQTGSSSATEVQAYQPLIYRVYIGEYEED